MKFGNRVLDLSSTKVMGILNATPDSFSDGGRYLSPDKALRKAESLASAGASIIDVGGESTRPGASPVDENEELDRVALIVERIASNIDVVVSVDTSSAKVITEVSKLGAGLINDVRALRSSGALDAAILSQLPVCLMHMVGNPFNMQQKATYNDVFDDVFLFLEQRVKVCVEAGIPKDKIIIDPGFGFGKTLEQNLILFKRVHDFSLLDCPLLVGVSRKSMIGDILNKDVNQRLIGGLGFAAYAALKGVSIIRTHDVDETNQVIKIFRALALK